jgi:flavorubredoxin
LAPIELAKGTYWVGVVDWNLRHFHGPAYSTHKGTSYNAYLIVDEKIALVDTVMESFAAELIANIRAIVDPAKIDYIVLNHGEKDHSGSFPAVHALCPQAEVICSAKGVDSLTAYYGGEWPRRVVKTGDQLSLGAHTLAFLEAPMLHWPDSMFTYISDLGILLSNDAFGQHLASSKRFDDEVDQCEVMDEAAKYYANILLPFSDLVTRKLAEVSKLGLDLKMIAPAHGVIWRKNPGKIVDAYARWASGEPDHKVVVVYDTMWNATEKMAKAIVAGITECGVVVKLFKASVTDRNDIIKDILNARAVVIGSPTVNNEPLVEISPLLDDIMGLKPKRKLGFAFGAHGWAGGAIRIIEERLQAAKVTLVEPGFGVKWSPTSDDLEKCREYGRKIADAVMAAE